MAKIYSYIKYISTDITRTIAFATVDNQTVGTELATVGNLTYISIPDNVELPQNQPAEIVNTIQEVTLTGELREQIKAASPHCKLIAQRVIDKIREQYSEDDERYFTRVGVGVALGVYEFQSGEQAELLAFGEHVEACRQWGREQRAALGL